MDSPSLQFYENTHQLHMRQQCSAVQCNYCWPGSNNPWHPHNFPFVNNANTISIFTCKVVIKWLDNFSLTIKSLDDRRHKIWTNKKKKSNNKTLKCLMPETMKKTINDPYVFAVKLFYDIISIEQMVKIGLHLIWIHDSTAEWEYNVGWDWYKEPMLASCQKI